MVDMTVHASGANGELSERIVRFAHGSPHREPNPLSALDFPTIREELRCVLEFIRASDPMHFDGMSKGVHLDFTAVFKSGAVGS